MVRQEVEPEDVGARVPEHVADEHEVAERLAHLLALVTHHGDVHPEPDERPDTGRDLGLRDLALVMGEDEVGPAAVDVERVAKILGGHRAALDVPAGSTGAPRRVPTGFAGRGGLPQHEVERVALVRIVRLVAALVGDSEHVVARNPAQLAELGILGDLEVDVAVSLVGDAPFDKARDEADDALDVLCRRHIVIGVEGVEVAHVAPVLFGLAAAELVPLDP